LLAKAGEPGLLLVLTEYCMFSNYPQPYQSLGYETPSAVYKNATGGGAKIAD
jgi:hypothetical protein